MNRLLVAISLTLGLALSACAADSSSSSGTLPRFDIPKAQATIFQNAESWTLFATDPMRPMEADIAESNLHGYEILGQALLSDVVLRAELVRELNRGIEGNDDMVAACFNPRHGLRAETEDGVAELVICFECLQIYIYEGGGERSETVLTSKLPRAAFNRIFTELGLEIAK